MLARQLSFAAVMSAWVVGSGAFLAPPAMAEAQRVIAIVNDQPVTERDISQRIAAMGPTEILWTAGRERVFLFR